MSQAGSSGNNGAVCDSGFSQPSDLVLHKEVCVVAGVGEQSGPHQDSMTPSSTTLPIPAASSSHGIEERESPDILPEDLEDQESEHSELAQHDYDSSKKPMDILSQQGFPEKHADLSEDLYDDDEADYVEYGDDMEEDFEEEGEEEEKQLPPGLNSNLPQLPGMLGMTNPLNPFMAMRDNNVTIESLENTKVAVAQFVENNDMSPSDLAMLQTTLYSLQQQQLFQLQLLQQIQQQIMTAAGQASKGGPNSAAAAAGGLSALAALSSMVPPHMAATVGLPNLESLAAKFGALATSKPGVETHDGDHLPGIPRDVPPSSSLPAPVSSILSKPVPSEPPQTTADNSSGPKSTSTSGDEGSMKPVKNTSSSCGSGSISTPVSHFPSSLSSLQLPPTTPLSTVVPELNQFSMLSNGKSPNAAVSGTVLDRSQYAADDPFFKHKCRFCHKVFGSDSALQIHIRSHTGERPFKCNICGNRFSTKGNLKVHFVRHKEKYPHVKMNPNPVPEYLDSPSQPMAGPKPSTSPSPSPLLPTRLNMSLPPTSIPVPATPETGSQNKSKEIRSSHLDGPMKAVIMSPPVKEEKPLNMEIKKEEKESLNMRPEVEKGKVLGPTPNKAAISLPASLPHTPSLPLSNLTPAPISSLPASMASGFPGMPPFPSPIPTPGGLPLPTSLAGPHPGLPPPPPFGFPDPVLFPPRPSILPNKVEDPMEQYMEVQKSETSKLEQLVKNIETKLTDPNQCAICHRILSCKSALQMHYRTHTGERPFKCKICSRAFTTKGNLKTHMGVHRTKPPMRMLHQCPVCHKQFTNALVLQQHIRMHTGEVPKEFPLPMSSDLMMPPMSYLPFPGMPPFFAPGMPPPPFAGFKPEDIHKLGEKRPAAEMEKSEDAEDSKRARLEAKEMDRLYEEQAREEQEDQHDMEQQLSDSLGQSDGEGNEDFRDCASRQSTAESQGSAPTMNTEEKQDRYLGGNSYELPNQDDRLSPRTSVDYSLYSQTSLAASFPTSTSYSASLQALEERVKAIDSSNMLISTNYASRPLEQMENVIRRADRNFTPVSEAGREEGSRSTSPTMPSLHQEYSVPSRDYREPSSPAHSEAESFDSSTCLDKIGNALSPSRSFGALDLTPKAFEATTGKPFTTCNICFKTFACKSALDIHYRSHTKERPFKCDLCDRCFSTKGNMKQHMLTHKVKEAGGDVGSPETPVSLMVGHPPFSSAQRQAVKATAPLPPPAKPLMETPKSAKVSPTTPTSEPNSPGQSPFVRRPSLKHQCQVCQKPFSSASALQIHMRTHTGDKPFKCNVCGKAFTTKGNLKVHMSTHMWNNGPSRRGRRMSVEGIPGIQNLPPKDAEFFRAFAHRSTPAEMFPPFPYPGFPNSFPHKMNEISVIQNVNGVMGHHPPSTEAIMSSMASNLSDGLMKARLPPSHPAMLKHEDSIKMKKEPESLGSPLPFPSPLPHPSPVFSQAVMSPIPSSLADSMLKARLPPQPQPPSLMKSDDPLNLKKESEPSPNAETNNNFHPVGSSGELDLSMRKSPVKSRDASSPPLGSPVEPKQLLNSSGSSTAASLSGSGSASGSESSSSPPWLWNSRCHMCHQVCPSPGALESHMKAHFSHREEPSHKTVMT